MRHRRDNAWPGIIFITALHLVTFVWLPIHVYFHGVHRSEIILFGFYFVATSFAITMGYHRFFTHSTFKSGKIINFLLLFFGAATYEGSALKWASMHRTHHQFTDTEKDPYNIKNGFFYAHMGWFIFWWFDIDYNNAKDLQKDALVMHQHRYFQRWAFVSSVVTPLLIGALTGHLLGAFLWSVAARICLVHHSAFFINSFAHTFGSRPYDASISARDNWVGAFLTNGEGYHNFHHKFPMDYRNGIRWYHWDPTKWVIWFLSLFGIARDLRRTPEDQISAAKKMTLSQGV